MKKLLFNFDARDGSFIEKVSGTVPTITSVEAKQTEKGIAGRFNGTTSKIDTGSTADLSGDITVEAIINPVGYGTVAGNILVNGKVVFSVSGSKNIVFYSDGATITGSSNNSILLNDQKYHVIVTRTSAGVTNFYINGVLSGTANQSSGTPATGTTNIIIGNRSAGGRTFDGDIPVVRIYEGILTAQERQLLYEEFLQSRPISLPAKVNPKIEHTSVERDPGLVLFHNYENGNAKDLVGNYDGTPVGVDFGSDGANISNAYQYITITLKEFTHGQTWSAQVRCKDLIFSSATSFVMGGSTSANLGFKNSDKIFFREDNTTYNLWNGTGNTVDAPYTLLSNSNDNVVEWTCNGTNIYLYVNGVSYGYITPTSTRLYIISLIKGHGSLNLPSLGKFKSIKLYNYARTLEEHKADYNKNVKLVSQPLVNLKADQQTVSAGGTLGDDIKVETGSVKVVEEPRAAGIELSSNITPTTLVDTDGNGLANGITSVYGGSSYEIITGSGWEGRAQRATRTTNNVTILLNGFGIGNLTNGKRYRLRLRYKTNAGFGVGYGNYTLYKLFTGDETIRTIDEIIEGKGTYLSIYKYNGDAGEYVEFDYMSCYEVQELPVGTKQIQQVTEGITSIPLGYPSTYYAELWYYNGSSWTEIKGTLSTLNSTYSWFSYDGEKASFDLDPGERIAGLRIWNGVRK